MARRSACSARTRTSTRRSTYRLAGQPGERTAKEIRPAPTCGRSVPDSCLRRDDGRRDERQGPGQRGRRRHRVRLLRLPRQRGGLADLGDQGATASVPVSHHVHGDRRWAAVHRPAAELEDRQRRRHDGFRVQAAGRARPVDLDELKTMKDMGELPSHFIVGGK